MCCAAPNLIVASPAGSQPLRPTPSFLQSVHKCERAPHSGHYSTGLDQNGAGEQRSMTQSSRPRELGPKALNLLPQGGGCSPSAPGSLPSGWVRPALTGTPLRQCFVTCETSTGVVLPTLQRSSTGPRPRQAIIRCINTVLPQRIHDHMSLWQWRSCACKRFKVSLWAALGWTTLRIGHLAIGQLTDCV